MSALSKKHRGEFVEPLQRVGRQLSQSLQDFRNRLSERTLETLGVPLRTTEMDLNAEDPRLRREVGKIFDRNGVAVFPGSDDHLSGIVEKHFSRKVGDVVS